MEICILSMQHVNNYGSVLQAYSLKKIIEELGHEVNFIDIKKGDNNDLNMQCNVLALDNDVKEKSWLGNQVQRVKEKVVGRKKRKIFEKFQVDILNIKNSNEKQRYDVCVIGSDEVFNCLQKSKWGFDPQLFGNVKTANRVITYAASCGATEVSMLSLDLKNAISKAMLNLKAISVRDENTAKFVEELIGCTYEYNMDPVAVGDFTRELQYTKISIKLPKRYCILYSYKDRISEESEIKAILEYCRKNDLELIVPFGKQYWAKNGYGEVAPFELLKMFENAESIITDTFHGALFGAKFAKRMAIIVRKSNKNKLEDLTRRLGIEKHVLTDIEELERVLTIEMDKKNIEEILQTERKKAIEYLKNNLNE